MNILDVGSGTIRWKLGENGENPDAILCFTCDENCETVVTAHRSGLFKLWDAIGKFFGCFFVKIILLFFNRVCFGQNVEKCSSWSCRAISD